MVDLSAVCEHLSPEILQVQTKVEQADSELKVEFQRQYIDVPNEIVHYYGKVRATYGLTTILCDELIVDRKNKTGQAKGKVTVLDPEGTIEAADLEFSYAEGQKTGSARDVKIEVGRMKIRAEKLQVDGEKWTLQRMKATPSATHPPEFELHAKQVTLQPGKSGKANQFGVSFFGQNLGTIPYITFSLDRRVTGFRLPAIAFQRGQGVGVGWGSTFLINPQTSATLKTVSLPKQFPSYTLEFAGSSIAPEKMIGRLTTRNDLLERLNDSSIDSILVPNPDREVRALRAPRATYSLGSYWNQASRGQLEDSEKISKPWDAAYEIGGPLGGKGGFLLQGRVQSVREGTKGPYTIRPMMQAVAHSGWSPLSPKLAAAVRIDSDIDDRFAWLRTMGLVRYEANSKLSLQAGYGRTLESGTARFLFDEPYNKTLGIMRADVNLGSITGVALAKYDFDRKEWSDVEYGLGLVAGSFEPYFNYRQRPRALQFGVRLRVQDFFEKLSDRSIGRSNQ